MDFELIARAGLTQKEFAELCDVSHTTVNLWVTGKMRPHRFVRDNVERRLAQLAECVDAGTLPLPNSKKLDRITAVRGLMAQPEAV